MNRIIYVIFILLSFIATRQSEAQEAPAVKRDSLRALKKLSLEELMNIEITTSGRREQKISDVPASVVVITREEIEAYGYQSLQEILSNALGMYKIDDYRSVGFGIRGFFSNVYNRDIVFMINGLRQQLPYVNTNDFDQMNIQVESIERIEFVRGPTAVIYGNDAFFGAINIITHEKGKNEKSLVVASYGSDNTYRGSMQINSDEENTIVNISAGFFHTDGRDVSFNKILDSVQRYDGVWIKDGTTKDFFKHSSGYTNISIEHKGFYANTSYDITNRNLIHYFAPVYDTTKLNRKDNAFRSKLGYRKMINPMISFDLSGSYVRYLASNSAAKALVIPNVHYGGDRVESQKMDVELMAFIKPLGELIFTLGTRYSNTASGYDLTDVPEVGVDRYSENLITPAVMFSAYLQGEYAIGSKISLLAGFRANKQYSYDFKNTKFVSGIYQDTIYTYRHDDVHAVPRVAVVYKINPKHILKLMYGEAISRPSIYENSYVTWVIHPELIPQTISTMEVNYITGMFSDFTFTLSAFFNKLNNLINRQITLDPATGPAASTNNSGEFETMGAELQVLYKPVEKLSFDVSMSYQKTTDKLHEINAAYSPNFLAYFKAIYNIKTNIVIGTSSYYVGSMESEWDPSPVDPANGDMTPKGRIHKAVPGYFNLCANIRFNNILKTGFYFSLHGENLLNADIYYAPTLVNSEYLPKGTVDSGIYLYGVLGFKF